MPRKRKSTLKSKSTLCSNPATSHGESRHDCTHERCQARAGRSSRGRGRIGYGTGVEIKLSTPAVPSFPVLDPWPEAVDAATVPDEITRLLRRYLILPPHAAKAMAPWIVPTNGFDGFDHSPRLAITSPERLCGKGLALPGIEPSGPLPGSEQPRCNAIPEPKAQRTHGNRCQKQQAGASRRARAELNELKSR